MKYALNLEPEARDDYFEFDAFEEEAMDSFGELDEYSDHECESCSEFDPEFDGEEWEAEVMRGRRVPQRPLRIRPGMRRPRFRPRVIRRPGQVIGGPSICTCPAPNCPRHGSEYVRWVQSALNQIMNLRLAVTGNMNPPTRSALRSFQEKQGLPVDGIAGPETKEALIAAKGGKSPGAGATKPAEPGMPEPTQPAATPSEPASAKPAAEFDFEWETGLNHFEDSFGEFEDRMGEMEWEEEAAKRRSAFRYVKNFASSDADCMAAMDSAKKNRSQALAIINTQIGQAIRMLRVAANKLKRGNRSPKTKEIFQKVFRVKPEFVPTWLKQTATIKDRGDVVATRCSQVANLLERGGLRYFCTISSKNCPDCPDGQNYSTTYACSSWGDESVAPRNSRVICLNIPFWKAMGATPIDIPTILAVLMHEPFHVYYGIYVTGHDRANPGKFGAIYCTTQFVFEINGKTNYPAWMKKVCDETHVRR